MLIYRLLLSVALGLFFIAHAWAHLQNVPDAAIHIAFAAIGGANFGLAIAAFLIHFYWRD